MNKESVLHFFTALAAKMPQPKTELRYLNPYTLVVAVSLSAQATDVSVNKATDALFKIVKSPQAMVALGEAKLKNYIKTIGLYNMKAKNVIAMSQMLIDEHGGEVPRDRAALEKLPGVGRKTANVVMNEAFGIPTIAVDTHVFRVANRTGLAPGHNVREVEDKLMKVVPKKFLSGAHHWLILHGRYTCKARKPDCPNCVVRKDCEYPDKTV
ncbi:MAG: endonuclease III [Alphaproteobacteria bacterium]|nr:endonuclease III [Alphaproteobacteria bacterium]